MRGYLERKISPKIQEGRFQEIEVIGFRRLPTRVFMLHEVRQEKGFLFKGLFGQEKLGFQALLDVSSPWRWCESSHRRLVLRLDEGVHLGVGMYA